jgi:hypothetical protein
MRHPEIENRRAEHKRDKIRATDEYPLITPQTPFSGAAPARLQPATGLLLSWLALDKKVREGDFARMIVSSQTA